MKDERTIGFIQGVAYAASLLQQWMLEGGEELMRISNISDEDFLKYADEHDLKTLGLIEED